MQNLQTQEKGSLEDTQPLVFELMAGLQQAGKTINPKFFYDARGSALFEKIMALPEYYPTRTEIHLLQTHREDISNHIGQRHILIEPGAGNCEKVKYLLGALKPMYYVPIDISADFLFTRARQLGETFNQTIIYPVAADMQADIQLPEAASGLKKTIFYPGSTIGNYSPDGALAFLQHCRKTIGDNGGLLIGVDLQKDAHLLHQAYNDAQGITAAFNLNVLEHVNRLVNGNFNTRLFSHVAFYNNDEHRIEMHLQSNCTHDVRLLDKTVRIQKNERIQTEYSYKYTIDSFMALAKKAGLKAVKHWVDEQQFFSLQYFITDQ